MKSKFQGRGVAEENGVQSIKGFASYGRQASVLLYRVRLRKALRMGTDACRFPCLVRKLREFLSGGLYFI